MNNNVKSYDIREIIAKDPDELANEIQDFKIITILDRDIDVAGTFLTDVGTRLFEKSVSNIKDAVNILNNISS